MMPTDLSASELARVDPAGLAAYLRASGWREGDHEGRAVIWTPSATTVADAVETGSELLVPTSSELRDYPRRMAEVVKTLSEVEQRPATDVLQDLRSPRIDVQYLRTMPDSPTGTIPLHEGYLALKGVRDLFLAAATSTVSPDRLAVLPSKKPDQAHGFLDQVRLGQTRKGSYVLRVETPLPPPDVVPPVSSRDVLLHLYQAMSSARDAAAQASGAQDRPEPAIDSSLTAFTERIGDGVSANLCKALVDIGGLRRSAFELRFAWAPAAPVPTATPPLLFDQELITSLKAGEKHLRDLPYAETATIIGRVVDLHRSPMDRLGKVQVDGIVILTKVAKTDQAINKATGVDGEQRTATVVMRLAAREYDLAVAAHSARQQLQIIGMLRHTGRQFEVSKVSSVELVVPRS